MLLLGHHNIVRHSVIGFVPVHAARHMLKHVLVRHMIKLISAHVLKHVPARHVPELMLQNSLLEPSLSVIDPLVSKILTNTNA